jgi:hypothetical protein
MMPQVDADFHRAVGDFLKNSNMIGENAVIGDFLGIVEITDFNDDSEQTQYALLLLGGVPKHRVWGLIKVAQDLLEGQ